MGMMAFAGLNDVRSDSGFFLQQPRLPVLERGERRLRRRPLIPRPAYGLIAFDTLSPKIHNGVAIRTLNRFRI